MRAIKEKNNFITEISHDMLAPLAVIKASLQCSNLDYADPHLELIETKASELESILNDLMVANLQDNTEYKMYIGELSTRDLRNIITMCDYKNKIFQLQLEDCVIRCNEVRTTQIISNIIVNSYKYAHTEIVISGVVEQDKFVLTIRDFGDGLNASELKRLTERYYRGSNAEDSNGAGLGLYIASTCQRLQDGTITLEWDNGLHVVLTFVMA